MEHHQGARDSESSDTGPENGPPGSGDVTYHMLAQHDDELDDDEQDGVTDFTIPNGPVEVMDGPMDDQPTSPGHRRFEHPYRFDNNAMAFQEMTEKQNPDEDLAPDSGYASRCRTQESLALLHGDDDDDDAHGKNVFVTDDADADEVWLVRQADLESWERQPVNDLDTIEEERSMELMGSLEMNPGQGPLRVNSRPGQGTVDVPAALTLPYVTELKGMKLGRSLTVDGFVEKHSKNFSLSLQNGEGDPPNVDVLLMIHPSIPNDNITCTSYIYGEWMGADTVSGCPFSGGRTFTLRVDVLGMYYKVYVNGREVLEYDHNADASKVTHLRLDGDVTFYSIQYPIEMKLPYIEEIEGGLRAGHEVLLDGRIPYTAKRFGLTLCTGPNVKDSPVVFSTTLTFEGKDITIVECDSLHKKKAGETVTVDGNLGIIRGHEIGIKLLVFDKCFKVHIDGYPFAEYDHKLPVEKLTHAVADGDIQLYSLIVTGPRSKSRKAIKKVSGSAGADCDCCTLL